MQQNDILWRIFHIFQLPIITILLVIISIENKINLVNFDSFLKNIVGVNISESNGEFIKNIINKNRTILLRF